MERQATSIDRAIEAFGRAQFAATDVLRRMQGNVIATLGFDPSECPYQIIASGWHWRLRDYGGHDAGPAILIVAAPIKRPYVWDLAPTASAIRHCLQCGLRVHLLEWMPASGPITNCGLDDCIGAIGNAVMTISARTAGARPFLIGHSLGGTLAAIFAAFAPDSIQGLIPLCAPLCFRPGESRFRDALVSLLPQTPSEAEPFPGSLLSHMSALASPDCFIWSRWIDAALSLSDPRAMEIHARVERWALDEMPLPGRLVRQIVEWLYRENRFCRGDLIVGDKVVNPSHVSAPILAVVNNADEIAPLASIKPFLDQIPTKDIQIIQYAGEIGVALQHLGILIGSEARARTWPGIVAWLASRAQLSAQPGTVRAAPSMD